jgi:REP element-mobilizing transposase RayT
MARPLRIEHPGAIWHVTSRGNARQDIALDDIDRVRFIATLGCVAPTMRWRLHAWVLMSNHHHLLVETPDANLARGMRQLNGIYSQASATHGNLPGFARQEFPTPLFSTGSAWSASALSAPVSSPI